MERTWTPEGVAFEKRNVLSREDIPSPSLDFWDWG